VRPSDPSCIFCKIVRGEIPARVVYRDDGFIAFLDIHPVAKGHVLVVPTAHLASLTEGDPRWLGGLGEVLARVSRAVMAAASSDGLNVLANVGPSAGQLVDHVHFHLIPRRVRDRLNLVNWKPEEASQEELAELERRIRGALG